MDWTPTDSKMFKAYRWIPGPVIDGVEFGTLEIEWNNGSKGAYHEVNRRTFDDFEAAKSRGRFINESLKPAFKYVRQEPEDAEGQEKPTDATEGSEGPEAHPKP